MYLYLQMLYITCYEILLFIFHVILHSGTYERMNRKKKHYIHREQKKKDIYKPTFPQDFM